MDNEQWKPIVGWEGFYEVSDLGRVRSSSREGTTTFGRRAYGGTIVKPFPSTRGYAAVNLTRRGARAQIHVHKAVLEAFVGPRPKGMQACHFDGDRSHAALRNLRWDTVSNNHADKVRHGTDSRGAKNPNAILTSGAAIEIRNSSLPLKRLAAKFGVSLGCVEKVRYGSTWRHL